MAVVGY